MLRENHPGLVMAASLRNLIVATTSAEARAGVGRPGIGVGRVGSGHGAAALTGGYAAGNYGYGYEKPYGYARHH